MSEQELEAVETAHRKLYVTATKKSSPDQLKGDSAEHPVEEEGKAAE